MELTYILLSVHCLNHNDIGGVGWRSWCKEWREELFIYTKGIKKAIHIKIFVDLIAAPYCQCHSLPDPSLWPNDCSGMKARVRRSICGQRPRAKTCRAWRRRLPWVCSWNPAVICRSILGAMILFLIMIIILRQVIGQVSNIRSNFKF